MNRNDLLFENTFVKDLDIKDLPTDKKEQFRRYYEHQIEQQKRQEILEKQKRIVKNSPKFTTSSDIYSELASFNPSTTDGYIQPERENIKIEKKTIVSIDSRNRDLNKFPKQNDFIVFLRKTFYNVKKIELVSSEFPNTDQVIKDKPPQLQNNLVSWQNKEDVDLNFFTGLLIDTVVSDNVDIVFSNHGFTVNSKIIATLYNSKLATDSSPTGFIDATRQLTVIDKDTFRFPYTGGISGQGTTSLDLDYPNYSVQLKPGNYTATTLSDQIEADLGRVKRRDGLDGFHFFEVTVNLDTDVMSLDSVITSQLSINPISTVAGSTTVTVNQNSHGFKTGDRVKMIGVKNTAGIRGTTLNGDFTVSVLDFNTFTYEVITRASETADGGGNTVVTGKDAPFRLLFDTENTRIQFNTGFPNENSSEAIGASNPITTTALSITDATIISSTQIRFTTTSNHGLNAVSIHNVSSIGTGNNPTVTTATAHGITVPKRVTLRNTDTVPQLNGTFFAIPTGVFTFSLQGLSVITAGTTGQVLYGTDKIQIFNLKTIPSILIEPVYFVENIPSPNQFDISFRATSIDQETLSETIIGTSQIFINHPSHGFNELSSITGLSSTVANVKTFLPHTLVGSITDSVSIIDGPSGTNTVDVLLNNHGLVTSSEIRITNSTTTPDVNGTYKVQVVDQNTLRINFVHSSFTDGDGTVLTGDRVTVSETNSLPRIDGTYSIHNREIITNISTGTVTSTITTSTTHNWSVGDIITISDSDSAASVNGEHTIQSIVSSTSFEIDLTEDVTSPGTFGIAVNNNRFEIITGFSITTPGTNPAGILGRDNNVLHYRIQGQTQGANNIANVPLSVLNGTSRSIDKLIDVDNYMVRVIEEYANKTVSAGGSNVKVSSQRHGLRSIQSNTVDGTTQGDLFRAISLEGENYVYLISQAEGVELDTVLNTSNISNTFAKIILSESPGTLMFNTFISEAKVFDNPIAKIDTMRFRIVTSEGFAFNFNDIDYSFTLRITELVDQLQSAFVSSRTGTTEFKNLLGSEDVTGGKKTKESGKSGTSTETATGSFQSVRSSSGRG